MTNLPPSHPFSASRVRDIGSLFTRAYSVGIGREGGRFAGGAR